MKFNIIAVGQKMPHWVNEACADYQKRMPRDKVMVLYEVPIAARKNNKDRQKLQNIEWQAQQKYLPAQGVVIALDEKGKQWSTQQWAEQLERWMLETSNVSFLLGGPDGLSQAAKQQANQLISLGKMTMPHGLARVVLIEQIYRAYTLYQKHPYHREG